MTFEGVCLVRQVEILLSRPDRMFESHARIHLCQVIAVNQRNGPPSKINSMYVSTGWRFTVVACTKMTGSFWLGPRMHPVTR
jgi:hypothetical protein